MKVVPSAGNGYKKIVHLPLVDDEPEEMTKSNSISYELRTNPADATSAKYKVNLRIIDGTESVRVLITWYEIVPKVLAGMDIASYTPSKSLIERNLKGVALSNFRSSLTACSTFARKEAAETAYAGEADPTKKQDACDAEINHRNRRHRLVTRLVCAVHDLVLALLRVRLRSRRAHVLAVHSCLLAFA